MQSNKAKDSTKFPKNIEQKWYEYWLKNKFFNSKFDTNKEPFTIVMPPPNITGILHMGHILNNTIQDIIIRKARMEGKEACWVPGTDHASIATESKVVEMLKKNHIEKDSLTREQFLEHAWAWKYKYGDIIVKQLKKLGISCDWSRFKFTLDEDLSKGVIKAFIDLHEQGYIYRGNRMIHWDPVGKTALSDDEVFYKETNGILYYINYKISGSEELLTIATSRPETIMGDAAICVNPTDERYKHLIGKTAIVPLINNVIPIISDPYVSKDFGTGCLKVTPAHDMNDAELGKKFNLDFIDILNEDATLNNNAQICIGQDRFEARKQIVKMLVNANCLVKEEPYKQNIGYSERTNAIVEPKISVQWFLKMQNLSKLPLKKVMDDIIQFHPKKYKNIFKVWMENIKDWCISRQLWWGHQIPAYYLPDGSYVLAYDIEEAVKKAKKVDSRLTINDLKQDEDVLDTWFSSWLWPINVFDGINNPDNPEINYYYPTNVVVTAPEIIFFWIARMIMAGYKFTNNLPFKNVYFTGIVKDKKGHKMSKSLGNSPDPILLMDKYSVDGVRAGMMFCSPAGNDLMFDEKLCEQGRNFANKVWNAYNLIHKWQNKDTQETDKLTRVEELAIKLFETELKYAIVKINSKFKNYKISEILIIIYKLICDKFCSMYLEIVKPTKETSISQTAVKKTIDFFESLLKLLHPFMPFITEEIWHLLKSREQKDSITIAKWPDSDSYNKNILQQSSYILEFITNIRRIKIENGVTSSIKIYSKAYPNWYVNFKEVITKLLNIVTVNIQQENALFLNISESDFSVYVEKSIDKKKEQDKLREELSYYQNFLQIVEKKLANKNFVEKAPKQILDLEIRKKKDILNKIQKIEKNLD